MMADQKEKHIEILEYIAPWGIYCKACESYGKNMYWMQV